jgi:hypothetical protein
MTFLIGLILGFAREFSVVKYYKSIQAKSAFLGSALSLAIGSLDLVVLARLALNRDVLMAIGFLCGETMATYFGIKT